MLKRLFSAQYPIQCNLVNNLCSDPELSSSLVALLASRYNGMPDFLRMKVSQKKKKESVLKDYEDCVVNKYMEINGIGLREVEEAYEFGKDELVSALKLIEKNFFNDKEKIIIKKNKKHKKEETLF